MTSVRPRVLLPLDGSPTASGILVQLADYLATTQAEAIVLHVLDETAMALLSYSDGAIDRGDYVATQRCEAHRHLEHMVGHLEAEGVATAMALEEGDAAEVVARVADAERVSTIALTSHGCSSVPRWGHGSVVGRILRRSSVPVLVMPAFHKEEHQDQPSLRTATHGFDRILVAVGPEGAAPLIEPVTQIASALLSQVMLLHVMPKVAQGVSSAHAERILDEARAEFEARGVPASVALRRGDVPGTILDFDWGADTLAMCTRRPTADQAWSLGNVAEKVVDATYLPLLLVPPVPSITTARGAVPAPAPFH